MARTRRCDVRGPRGDRDSVRQAGGRSTIAASCTNLQSMAEESGSIGREMELLTVGYESRTLPQLIRLLKEHEVTHLVDVRERPISRKKGFSALALVRGHEEGRHRLRDAPGARQPREHPREMGERFARRGQEGVSSASPKR